MNEAERTVTCKLFPAKSKLNLSKDEDDVLVLDLFLGNQEVELAGCPSSLYDTAEDGEMKIKFQSNSLKE